MMKILPPLSLTMVLECARVRCRFVAMIGFDGALIYECSEWHRVTFVCLRRLPDRLDRLPTTYV
jgi:hypothetical protein